MFIARNVLGTLYFPWLSTMRDLNCISSKLNLEVGLFFKFIWASRHSLGFSFSPEFGIKEVVHYFYRFFKTQKKQIVINLKHGAALFCVMHLLKSLITAPLRRRFNYLIFFSSRSESSMNRCDHDDIVWCWLTWL